MYEILDEDLYFLYNTGKTVVIPFCFKGVSWNILFFNKILYDGKEYILLRMYKIFLRGRLESELGSMVDCCLRN
jgi:hypothetical protein|nr:hypothetical protein BN993_01898 [Virgibacillus halodenitrificans]